MNIQFNIELALDYKSESQKIRILSEDWVYKTIFCPNCGNISIDKYPNNKPVADFYCVICKEDYELKSKRNVIGKKIIDGAYSTMLQRLKSSNNPNFFLLSYDLSSLEVINFFVIPKHFFIPQIIEKRNPLKVTARRGGWVGCNIILKTIPQSGKIYFIRNKQIENKKEVIDNWKRTLFLREEDEVLAKGWLLDIMRCIEKLDKNSFTLNEVYSFEKELARLYPDNKHIKDKIRQQLQILRDKGYLDFISRGCYRLN